ncbi:diacylglycerol kinase [Pseudidiomarina aestuarii]|uniref:Diacylglycerol kinase n=1 Tax=Pseudidiomarina aestuarii TaxID=624146 RepID=A0A7Z6ZS94_9GAMM|nr:diacylglycerol kinase [Pseudidiomarina aestuarii]RUO39435.1 diacylglycerol kinase [Pseudidiomarina aestuarii]
MKPGQTGLTRIYHATHYSFKGLRAAWLFEAAFRQEVWLGLVLFPILILAPITITERAILLLSYFTLLLTELLNSAIEAVVDRIGPEFHELSGRAKDIASAAVFIGLTQLMVIWSVILWPH